MVCNAILEKNPIFLCVDKMDVQNTFNNVYALMLKTLFDYGCLELNDLQKKLIYMGLDEGCVF
jgi:hypothetical protein